MEKTSAKTTTRTSLWALILVLNATLAGCATVSISENNAGTVYDKLISGNYRLSSAILSAGVDIFSADRMADAAVRKDWATLSKLVIQANTSDDLSYYYLGLATWGLGYKNAARKYFELSIQSANQSSESNLCTDNISQVVWRYGPCHGIRLPRDAELMLEQLGS